MKILSLFKMSKEDKENKEVERLGRSLKRGQEALIDKLDAEKDKLENTIEKLESLEPSKVNADTWNTDYHKAKVDLKLKEAEIAIAKEISNELFSETVTTNGTVS